MNSNLVTTEQLKNLSSIGLNIDCELLLPHINIAQELYVAPILGQCLYDDLLTNFDANTLSTDYETLLNDFVTPAIAFASWYSVAPFLHMRTSRNGINKSGTDTLVPVELSEFNMYLSKVENLKSFFLNKLEDFLKCNKSTYPKYCENVAVQSNGGSIYLGWRTHPKKGRFHDANGYDADTNIDSLSSSSCNGCGNCPNCT